MEKKTQQEFQTYKCLCVARSGWGKTHIIIDFIKQLVESGQVDAKRVVIYSQTVKTDTKQRDFVEYLQNKAGNKYNFEQNNTAKEIVYKFLEMLYNQQEKLKERGQQYHHWLIWFDDQIVDEQIRNSVNPILRRMAFIGRHYGISQIWNMQTFRSSIDPAIRENMNVLMLGALSSEEKQIDLIKQFSSQFDREDYKNSSNKLYKAFLNVINTPHQFLIVWAEKPVGGGRFQVGLNGEFLDEF